MSDAEISDNINDLRLEKALAAELEKTSQIIKRTGIFDPVDNIYGEAGAEYVEAPEGGDGPGGPMGGGGGPIGGGAPLGGDDFGSELDGLGGPADDGMGEISGAPESTGMDQASQADAGAPTNESATKNGMPIIHENRLYVERLKKIGAARKAEIAEEQQQKVDIYSKNFFINEELNHLIKELDVYSTDKEEEELKTIISETE